MICHPAGSRSTTARTDSLSIITPPESPPRYGDGVFEVAGLLVEGFEFLVQRFELFFKILIADGLSWSHPYVATGVERPPLCLDLLDRGRLAETEHVGKLRLLAEDLLDFRVRLIAAEVKSRFSPR